MPKSKTPASLATAESKKTARGINRFRDSPDKIIVFRFAIMDLSGPWGWDKCSSSYLLNNIYRLLKDFETKTFQEMGTIHHSVAIDSIIPDAQRRLKELKQDDIEELFSLKISKLERLWGKRDRNYFDILWWDPKHEICPSNKKNT